MTPEAMKFWLDMFHSPVALTLAGALLGAVSTLAGVWLKSRSDAKESQKTWERQEKTRKEERLFSLKSTAYNDFAKLFALNSTTGNAHFYSDFIAVAIALANYGSLSVKQEVKTFFDIAKQWQQEQCEEKKGQLDKDAMNQLDIVHSKIIEDIWAHHESV